MRMELAKRLRGVGEKLISPVTLCLIANNVHPDTVTEAGRRLSKIGSVVLMNQNGITDVVAGVTGKDHSRVSRYVRWVGGVIWLVGIACDMEDGELARKSNQTSKEGTLLDAKVDREVDLLPWPFYNLTTQHPVDRVISEVNLETIALPAFLNSAANKNDLKVPELNVGSRFPRLITLTAFQLFPKYRRWTGGILAAQSIATTLFRYDYIKKHGSEQAQHEAKDVLKDYLQVYLRSKLTLEGLLVGFSTRQSIVDLFERVKSRELWPDKK